MINKPLEYFKIAYSTLSTILIIAASSDDFAKLLTIFSFGMICSYWGNHASISTTTSLEKSLQKKLKNNAHTGLWLSSILSIISCACWIKSWPITQITVFSIPYIGPIPLIDIPLCLYMFLAIKKAFLVDVEEPISSPAN